MADDFDFDRDVAERAVVERDAARKLLAQAHDQIALLTEQLATLQAQNAQDLAEAANVAQHRDHAVSVATKLAQEKKAIAVVATIMQDERDAAIAERDAAIAERDELLHVLSISNGSCRDVAVLLERAIAERAKDRAGIFEACADACQKYAEEHGVDWHEDDHLSRVTYDQGYEDGRSDGAADCAALIDAMKEVAMKEAALATKEGTKP
jgi:hypothetical protein